ncbi:hypothetical protein ACQ4LK_22280, partial [Bacillus pumilus]
RGSRGLGMCIRDRDKGANALAQQTLRELYTEELKKTKENEWLQKWFQEEHTEQEIIAVSYTHSPSPRDPL